MTHFIDERHRHSSRTHTGRGDPHAGGYTRRLSKAPDRVPWGVLISAAVVLAVVVGLGARL